MFQTMDVHWCKKNVEEANLLNLKSEILNIDRGCQFISEILTNSVLSKNIKLIMNGKGRDIDIDDVL